MMTDDDFDLDVVGPPDGSIRIAAMWPDDRPPVNLPSVARAHGTTWEAIVFAAVRATPGGVTSDDNGLKWPSAASARKALKAARKAQKGGA